MMRPVQPRTEASMEAVSVALPEGLQSEEEKRSEATLSARCSWLTF